MCMYMYMYMYISIVCCRICGYILQLTSSRLIHLLLISLTIVISVTGKYGSLCMRNTAAFGIARLGKQFSCLICRSHLLILTFEFARLSVENLRVFRRLNIVMQFDLKHGFENAQGMSRNLTFLKG